MNLLPPAEDLQELIVLWVNVSLWMDIAIIVLLSVSFAIYARKQQNRLKELYAMCLTIQQAQETQAENRATVIQSVSKEVRTTNLQLSESTRKIREQLKELTDRKMHTHITINNK